MDRHRYYYKLCVQVNGKFFLYMQRSTEIKLNEVITQDLNSPSPFLYVYPTPEQAASAEVHYSAKDLTNKLSQKIILKMKCWGTCIESSRKFAFSQISAVENLGISKCEFSVIRGTSKMRNTKLGQQRREISPRGVKNNKIGSPGRVYASVVARKASPVYKQSVQFFKEKSAVKDLLRKMQEDTEKIEKDFQELEKFNDFFRFEELDTDRTLKKIKK